MLPRRAGLAGFLLARLLRGGAVAGAWLLGLYLEWALRSTRWTVEGGEHLAPYLAGGKIILACWHERLATAPAFWLPSRRTYPGRLIVTLASRHRDGRFIAAILARFGVAALHGSTASRKQGGTGPMRDRGGAAGLRGLLAALAEGQAVVITPDGPRGPRRSGAPGTAQLAALSGAPVIAAAGQMRHRLILRSWDRMVFPLPFGRGALVCLPPITITREALAAGQTALQAALTEAADRADALCR